MAEPAHSPSRSTWLVSRTSPHRLAERRISRAVVLLCLLLAPACERKAPDPDECLAMAEAALRPLVDRGHHPGQLLAKHDELVRECLVTPFDDQLVACVERTGAYRACRADFELRRRIPR